MNVDRHWLRDIGMAVLLALPTAALTRPAASDGDHRPATRMPHLQASLADKPLQQRFNLPG